MINLILDYFRLKTIKFTLFSDDKSIKKTNDWFHYWNTRERKCKRRDNLVKDWKEARNLSLEQFFSMLICHYGYLILSNL